MNDRVMQQFYKETKNWMGRDTRRLELLECKL